jgi:hypothetical protein
MTQAHINRVKMHEESEAKVKKLEKQIVEANNLKNTIRKILDESIRGWKEALKYEVDLDAQQLQNTAISELERLRELVQVPQKEPEDFSLSAYRFIKQAKEES